MRFRMNCSLIVLWFTKRYFECAPTFSWRRWELICTPLSASSKESTPTLLLPFYFFSLNYRTMNLKMTTTTSSKSWFLPFSWKAMILTRNLKISQDWQTHPSQLSMKSKPGWYFWLMQGFLFTYKHICPINNKSNLPVLKINYFRSGSSFVGELLTTGTTSFYFFEPFYALRPK